MYQTKRKASLACCLILSLLLPVLAGCGAQNETTTAGSTSATTVKQTEAQTDEAQKLSWNAADSSLLSKLGLTGEVDILDANTGRVLVTSTEKLPSDSPYYSEAGMLSSFSEKVCLLSYPQLEVIKTVEFSDRLTCCTGGALTDTGFVLATQHVDDKDAQRNLNKYTVYSYSGESFEVSTVAEGYGTPVCAAAGDGILFAGTPQTGGKCELVMKNASNNALWSVETELADGAEFTSAELSSNGKSYTYIPYINSNTVYAGSGQEKPTEIKLPEGEKLLGCTVAGESVLMITQTADGSSYMLRLSDMKGKTLAEKKTAKRYTVPQGFTADGEVCVVRDEDNKLCFVSLKDGEITFSEQFDSAFDSDRICAVDNTSFIVYGNKSGSNAKTAKVITVK